MSFCCLRIKFSGLKLTNRGIIPDLSKVDAVAKAKIPTNVTEVRSFSGLENYCSQFTAYYAELIEPFRKLTKKNTNLYGPMNINIVSKN